MNKKTIGLFLSIFLALAIIPLASAAIAQVTPATASNQSANFATSWTFVNETDEIRNAGSANSTFYWNETGAWVAVTKSAFTCVADVCSATLDISTMGEGRGILNFTAGNNTAVLGGTIGGRFRVDKTNPTANIAVSAPQINQYQPETITWSSSDDGSTLQSTAVTIVSPNSACPTLSYTDASRSVQILNSQTSCTGTYTATIIATDYSGLSTTATATFLVPVGGGGVGLAANQVASNPASNQSKSNWIAYIIIAIAIILLLRKK
jgi:hypothetical protein